VGKTIEVTVPDIGDFSDVPVIEVLVSEGDRVEAEDSLITLESDKATMEVPSPHAGRIRAVRIKVGDAVSKGDVFAVLEVEDDGQHAVDGGRDAADEAAAGDEGTAETENRGGDAPGAQEGDTGRERPSRPQRSAGSKAGQPPEPAAGDDGDRPSTPAASGFAAIDPSSVPYASPAVRQYARELGVELARVKGSGGKGRILREDVSAFVKSVMTSEQPAAGGVAGIALLPPPKVDFSRFGATRVQPLSRIRKLAAGHLHRNWISIPHVTQHDEADITDMEDFRKDHAEEAKEQGFKLTLLVFLIKASVAALKKYPRFNASLDESGENLIVKSYYHLGIAVDTADGLVVPVLRDCERKGIMELARELAEVSARARAQKLKPQDIQGGCFSISSLGGIGGTAFTPIINAPEVAILGVSRATLKPVWNGEQFRPRLMLPLSLSYDHRVIDGADAARFTRYLCSCLEDLRRLTL
jgi:pyruvate dehydrogenase E2 component (dihydrolipoamide acetyltransferase)